MAWIGGAIAAGGAILGSVMSSNSASDANDTNVQLARENRDWNERMSNTQYQRAMSDMQAAGLNPMLAYRNGGAGVPSNSAATVQPTFNAQNADSLSRGVTSAAASYQDWQTQATNRELTSAQTAKTQAETANSLAMADQIAAQTALLRETVPNVKQDTSLKLQQTGKVSAEQMESLRRSDKITAEIPNIERTLSLINSEIARNTSSASNLNMTTKLLGLDVPRATNAANAEKSTFKKEVSPYLRDVGEVTGAVRNVAPLIGR